MTDANGPALARPGRWDGSWAPVFGLVLVQVFFGALAVVAQVAFETFPPLGFAALRVSAAAVLLWGLQRVLVKERVARRDLPRLAVFAFFGIVLNQILFMIGLSRTDPVSATVLVATIPAFTLLVAVLFRVERLGWRKAVGVLLAFAGVVVMVGVTPQVFAGGTAFGNLLITLNALSYSVYLVIARKVMRVYRPITVAAWTFTFGALMIVPIGIPSLLHVEWGTVPPVAWFALAYVVLFATVATYVLNNWALTRVASSTVAVFVYLQPAVAAVLAYLVFQTLPTRATLLGALFIFGGVWFASIARKSGRVVGFGRART